ncbi:Protein of unknown function [Gryllus bimaculatus]|nr:Protein of unknown function [Gryllus bimaculatus]
MNHCRMPVIECYKILVKVLQYILSVHRSVKDVRENHTCPEIGVLFVTDKNGHKGSEVTDQESRDFLMKGIGFIILPCIVGITYGSIGFHCAPVVQCKQVNLQQSTSQCSSFSIIYGASLGGDIGRNHHLHVFFFSEEGVPLLVDNAEWHRAVSLPAALNDQLVLRPGPCAPELSDVCYCVDEGRPEVDYFLLFMIRDEQHLGLLLAQHSSQLASTLTEALHLTTSVVTSYERGKAWSHMIASSLGALIRFSQNNKLRNECFSLMKAADSMELEAKLEQELIHHLY